MTLSGKPRGQLMVDKKIDRAEPFDWLTPHCYILETRNDSFQFKNSPAQTAAGIPACFGPEVDIVSAIALGQV